MKRWTVIVGIFLSAGMAYTRAFELKGEVGWKTGSVFSTNDSSQISLARNYPEIEANIEGGVFFWGKKTSLLGGIYGKVAGEWQWDTSDKGVFFYNWQKMECAFGLAGKGKFLSGDFSFFLPVAIRDYDKYNAKGTLVYPDKDMASSHTLLAVGTMPEGSLSFVDEKKRQGLDIAASLFVGYDIMESNRIEGNTGFILDHKTTLAFWRRFLSEKEKNLWRGKVESEFRYTYNSLVHRFRTDSDLEIRYTAWKVFVPVVKVLRHQFDVKVPVDDPSMAYDQLHFLSSRLEARVVGKKWEIRFWYEWPWYVLDRIWINEPSLMPHEIGAKILFEW
ncbi:MAG: hypothetical protein HPY78_08230 [Brevinematales bacterium]|nr:hypothetical protein [Brevinematales bacterium]